MERTLLIFIKNPEWGKAKTRLAKTVGNDRALEIYHLLLKYTRTVALATRADKALYYSSFLEEDEWDASIFDKHVQVGNDLGERMGNAFNDAFEAGTDKAVIIGSDCGELTPEILEKAFLALDEVPLVLGPAKDGGYYLLGMRKFHPSLFEAMPWSQANLLTKTLEKVEGLGLAYHLLPTLSDVDREEDWLVVQEKLDV